MSLQTWQETVATAQVDGAALGNSAVATSIWHATAKTNFGINYFRNVGQVLKITSMGRISTVTAAPGTLTLDLRLGAVIIANGGAMTLNVNAKTNVPWFLEWILTLRAVGTGVNANFMHQGSWMSEAVVGAPIPTAGGAGTHLLPNATPAVGTSFDSALAATLDLFATWQTANAANTLLTHQSKVEVLN